MPSSANPPDPAPELTKARELLTLHPELAPMTAAAGRLTTLFGPAGIWGATVMAQHAHEAYTGKEPTELSFLLPLFWMVVAFLAPEHFIPRGLNLQQAAAEVQEKEKQAQQPPKPPEPPAETVDSAPPPPYY